MGAWHSITLGIEEIVRDARSGDIHIFVADGGKSFDTVDRETPDCALGRLGLLACVRKVYFAFRSRVTLATGLCRLDVQFFIVALDVP